MTLCVCGSAREENDCCAPILAGTPAPTAEALLRSRYAAYVKGDVDYLERTSSPTALKEFDRADIEQFIEKAEWKGLDIKSVSGGGVKDTTGTIDCYFYCTYDKEQELVQHEIAHFVRGPAGQWLFDQSEINPKGEPVKVQQIGRNDPCPCGSGKKYKKCCNA